LGQKAPTATQSTPGSDDKPAKPVAVNPLTQAKPVVGIEGLYQLDINIISDITKPTPYNQLIDFLHRLEQNRRTAQVTQIAIQPDGKNRANLNFSLTVSVYIKP